jgi:hypothetical protein
VRTHGNPQRAVTAFRLITFRTQPRSHDSMAPSPTDFLCIALHAPEWTAAYGIPISFVPFPYLDRPCSYECQHKRKTASVGMAGALVRRHTGAEAKRAPPPAGDSRPRTRLGAYLHKAPWLPSLVRTTAEAQQD